MFCPNCGKELSEGAAFCPECGNALRAAAPTDASQTAPVPADAGQAAPAPTDASQTAPAPADAGQAAPAPVKKKEKKTGLVVAIILSLLIAAAGSTGFVLWNNDNFRCWLDVREASKMYEADDYERAVEAYQRALNRVEDSSEAIDGLMSVAKSYYKQENYEEALAIYDLILERDPENPKALSGQRDCYLTQGETALKKERYDKALDFYEKAQKSNKKLDSKEESETIKEGLLKAYMGLGQESYEKGDYLAARDYYDDILAEADYDSTLYAQAKDGHSQTSLMLAMHSHAVGDYKTAETYYREILGVEIVGILAYQGLADLYVERGDVENAVTLLEEGTLYYTDASLQQRLEALRNSVSPVNPYPIMTDANGNKYDLGGAKVYLYSWFGEGELDTPYWRAVNEYREWAQKEYNFTYEWKEGAGGWGDFQHLGEIAQGTFYENKELCMVMLPDASFNTVLSAADQNLLWDLDSLGVFDFSETRWTQNGVSDLFKAGGGVYACATGTPEPRGGVFFNATLLEGLAGITPDELYDLQAKNEWTWDKFKEICELIYQKGDTDGDGVQDVYALAANGRYVTSMAMYSNNTSYFNLRDDGKFEYRADSPATLEALEFQRELRRAPYWYNSAGAAWNHFYEAFDLQGKYVFLIDEAYQMEDGQRLSATDDENNAGEYGFLMFPMGPSAGGKYINCYHDNILVLPKCYNEDEARTIAAAFQIIYADVIPGFIGYNPRLDDYEAGVYHWRALNETLARIMSENAFIDSGKLLPGLDTSAAFDDTSKTVSEALAAVETQWKTAIDEYNYWH